MMKKVLTLAVFSSLTLTIAGGAVADMANFQPPSQPLQSQNQPPLNNRGFPGRIPGLDINVDANAIIQNWRRHEALSRNGTAPRSGVRINGRRVGSASRADEYLFACPPGGFLEISFGQIDQTGAAFYDERRGGGCEAGQALVLRGDRLECRWYTPRKNGLAGKSQSALSGSASAVAEILLSAETGTTILGECITVEAEVIPAIAFPEGRRNVRLDGPARQDCGGSGVMINGRVTGHRSLCGR